MYNGVDVPLFYSVQGEQANRNISAIKHFVPVMFLFIVLPFQVVGIYLSMKAKDYATVVVLFWTIFLNVGTLVVVYNDMFRNAYCLIKLHVTAYLAAAGFYAWFAQLYGPSDAAVVGCGGFVLSFAYSMILDLYAEMRQLLVHAAH